MSIDTDLLDFYKSDILAFKNPGPYVAVVPFIYTLDGSLCAEWWKTSDEGWVYTRAWNRAVLDIHLAEGTLRKVSRLEIATICGCLPQFDWLEESLTQSVVLPGKEQE